MVMSKARWHGMASSHKALTHTMDIAAPLPHSERFLWVTQQSWKIYTDMSDLWRNRGG